MLRIPSIRSRVTSSNAVQAIATMAGFVFFGVGWALVEEAMGAVAARAGLASFSPSTYSGEQFDRYDGEKHRGHEDEYEEKLPGYPGELRRRCGLRGNIDSLRSPRR
jgi:hypothetical protein